MDQVKRTLYAQHSRSASTLVSIKDVFSYSFLLHNVVHYESIFQK